MAETITSEQANEVGAIQNNLPGQAMRVAIENKDLLKENGSVYVGTGETNHIEISEGVEYDVPVTKAAVPSSGETGQQYLVHEDGETKFVTQIDGSQVTEVPNATNATNYTKEGGGTESIEQGIENAETKVTELENNLKTNVDNGYYAQYLAGTNSTLWGFESSQVFGGSPVGGNAEAIQAAKVNKQIANVNISDLLVKKPDSSTEYEAKVNLALNAEAASVATGYASGGGIDTRFKGLDSSIDSINSRLDSLGFKTATISYPSNGTGFIVANSARVYQEGKFVYGTFSMPSSVASTSDSSGTIHTLFMARGLSSYPENEVTIATIRNANNSNLIFSLIMSGEPPLLSVFIRTNLNGYWTNYWPTDWSSINFCYRTYAQDGNNWFWGALGDIRTHSR